MKERLIFFKSYECHQTWFWEFAIWCIYVTFITRLILAEHDHYKDEHEIWRPHTRRINTPFSSSRTTPGGSWATVLKRWNCIRCLAQNHENHCLFSSKDHFTTQHITVGGNECFLYRLSLTRRLERATRFEVPSVNVLRFIQTLNR